MSARTIAFLFARIAIGVTRLRAGGWLSRCTCHSRGREPRRAGCLRCRTRPRSSCCASGVTRLGRVGVPRVAGPSIRSVRVMSAGGATATARRCDRGPDVCRRRWSELDRRSDEIHASWLIGYEELRHLVRLVPVIDGGLRERVRDVPKHDEIAERQRPETAAEVVVVDQDSGCERVDAHEVHSNGGVSFHAVALPCGDVIGSDRSERWWSRSAARWGVSHASRDECRGPGMSPECSGDVPEARGVNFAAGGINPVARCLAVCYIGTYAPTVRLSVRRSSVSLDGWTLRFLCRWR